MEYYVYIIHSALHDKYYKGYTSNLRLRINQHNSGLARYTKNHVPWTLVYLEVYTEKREAIIRERSLKKYSKSQIEDLIQNFHPNKVSRSDFPKIN